MSAVHCDQRHAFTEIGPEIHVPVAHQRRTGSGQRPAQREWPNGMGAPLFPSPCSGGLPETSRDPGSEGKSRRSGQDTLVSEPRAATHQTARGSPDPCPCTPTPGPEELPERSPEGTREPPPLPGCARRPSPEAPAPASAQTMGVTVGDGLARPGERRLVLGEAAPGGDGAAQAPTGRAGAWGGPWGPGLLPGQRLSMERLSEEGAVGRVRPVIKSFQRVLIESPPVRGTHLKASGEDRRFGQSTRACT